MILIKWNIFSKLTFLDNMLNGFIAAPT